jgi:hypothetical protein
MGSAGYAAERFVGTLRAFGEFPKTLRKLHDERMKGKFNHLSADRQANCTNDHLFVSYSCIFVVSLPFVWFVVKFFIYAFDVFLFACLNIPYT